MITQCSACSRERCPDCLGLDREVDRRRDLRLAPRPFVKWAGGKRSLLTVYDPLLPAEIVNYWEPMCGGAAVFWHLQPRITGHAILGDVNADLMGAYRVLRDTPEGLLGALKAIAAAHSESYYYEARALDPREFREIECAARFMYLSRAGFNGLWRVNSKGQHNVPIGRNSAGAIYPGDKLFDFDNLRACSRALQGVELRHCPYDHGSLDNLTFEDFSIFIDPPYAPEKDTSFTRYQQDVFSHAEHIKLAATLTRWHERGAKILLANSDVALVRELYQEPIWNLTEVTARGSISAGKAGRQPRKELAIRNYEV